MRAILDNVSRRFRSGRLHLPALVAVAGIITASASAVAVKLDNQVVGDGHLSITVGEYGSYAAAFAGGPSWLDMFNPSPDPVNPYDDSEKFPTFVSHVFLFVDPSEVGNGVHRVALSAHAGILALYDDPTLTTTILQENSTDNLPFSTDSVFLVTGTGFRVLCSLTQTVSAADPGPAGEARALLEQTYSFTNQSGAVNLIMTRQIDEDMPWGPGQPYHMDDFVGVDFAELDRPEIYAQDDELTTAALVLRTREDMCLDPMTTSNSTTGACTFVYYCGKQNMPPPPGNPDFPGGGCPKQDSPFLIWNNFGVPNCWKNYVPGVGHDVPGISPDILGDSFIGLQTEAAIPTGGTYEITFQTLYGYRPPPIIQIPPAFSAQTVRLNLDTGCGEFLWALGNRNPVLPSKVPVEITEFYIDVEAGDGGQGNCIEMIPPPGWVAELCPPGFDSHGHGLYHFHGGPPIGRGEQVSGRLIIDTNGLHETTNSANGTVVPPLSVVLHAAQQQEDAVCNFNFGPRRNGEWSERVVATAYLPIPSMAAWARAVLAMTLTAIGAVLLLRSRHCGA